MKPALYWTIHRSFGQHAVVAVTSEKPRQLYGRNRHGEATHVRRDDCQGRFATEAEALALMDRVADVRARFEKDRRPLEREISTLLQREDAELRALCGAQP